MRRALSVAKEALWIFTGQAGSAIAVFVGVKLLTNLLGPHEFGKYALASSLIALIGTNFFGTFGQSVMRYWSLASGRGATKAYYDTIDRLIRNICLAAFFAAFAAFLVTLKIKGISWSVSIALSSCIGVVTGIVSYRASALIAMRRRREVSFINICVPLFGYLSAAMMVLLIARSSNLALAGYLVSSLALFIMIERFYSRTVPAAREKYGSPEELAGASKNMEKEMFSYAYPFFIWGVFGWVYVFSDRWALGNFFGSESVGLYTVVSQIAIYPFIFCSDFLSNFLGPVAFQRANTMERPHLVQSAFRILVAMVLIYIAAMFLVILLFYRFHLPLVLLVSNARFTVLSGLLPYLGMAWAFYYLGQLFTSFGMLVNRPQFYIVPKISASIAVILMMFCLIPKYGPKGAVAGLLFAGAAYAVWCAIIAFKIIRSSSNKTQTAPQGAALA